MDDGNEEYLEVYEEHEDNQWGPILHGESASQLESSRSHGVVCATMTATEVLDVVRRDVDKANEILGLSPENALLVLRRYRWKMDDATIDRYLDDAESILKELRIAEGDGSGSDAGALLARNSDPFTCPVCLDDVPAGEGVGLAQCRHFFCLDCLRTNLQYAVKHGDDLVDKRCPSRGCCTVVGLTVFKELLSPEEYGQVERRFVGDYLDGNTHMRCCPNETSCEGVIRVETLRNSGPVVRCEICSLQFCFKCLEPPHAPATCDMLRRWKEIIEGQGPSLQLITSTTKACPNCSVRVEKNKGCNHMTCTRCRHEYCWVCLGSWKDSDHDFYVCKNVGKETECVPKPFFLDCFAWWDNHSLSLKLEKKSLGLAYQRMQNLQSDADRAVFEKRLTLILNTKNVLRECRVVLMNAYIAFYFRNGTGTPFHYRIHQLELRTEEISRLIDVEGSAPDFDEIEKLLGQAIHWCNTLKSEENDWE